MNCSVLPLGEAIQRLYARELPPRSVAITFDDGGYDFYQLACPMLREYGFPVTLYLTTYYVTYNRPVFDVMLSYLLWKGRDRNLAFPKFVSAPIGLNAAGREAAEMEIRSGVYRLGLSAKEKDVLLENLAECLGLDYPAICAKRLLQLVTLDEARELAANGVDIQLHTHRHRVPHARDRFVDEIDANRRLISQISTADPVHFCYPCGYHIPEFGQFLAATGVESATTCDPGLACHTSDRLFLPRFLDAGNVTEPEFLAWVSGLGALLPRRGYPARHSAILERLAPAS